MIKYAKINDLYVEVYLNEKRIGLVENHKDSYSVEVNYIRRTFTKKRRRLISGYMSKLYYKLNKPAQRIGKSILKQKYKILK